MFRWRQFHLVLAVYGLLVSASAFITALILFLTPSDPRNIVFLGLSLQRLIMLGGVSLVGILLIVFAIKAYRDKMWAERVWLSVFGRKMLAQGIRWGAVAGLTSGWIVYFTPLYHWGNYQDYFLRISPFIVWFMFVSALTFVIAWIEKYGFHWQSLSNIAHVQKKALSIALISMAIFILIWVFVAVTGLGLWVSDGYWYGAGVPILGLQIALAFAIGIGFFFLERSSLSKYIPAWSDLLFFFLLWGLTAFLWVREPLPSSFFAPGPYLPDYQYHPFSDAATFDLGSQFALIGQGINNGEYFDRALYMAFLVFLHKFAGQDYTQVVALQAAIYAVFPGILYCLGKAIYSRSFGVILAVLAILRGINGIAASTMIDLANQKQMLTDFPTAIFVAWFALMIVRWLKAPAKNYLYSIWAGGIVGLAVMLRTNALFLLLFAALLVGIVYWRQKLRGMLVGFLIVIAMFAGTFAWGAYNDKSVFDVYIYRILLVIRARYPQPATPTPTPQGSENPAFNTARQAMDMNVSFPIMSSLNSITASPVQSSSVVMPLPNGPEVAAQIKPIPVFVTIHFLHNIIESVFILPTSAVFYDLSHTVKGAAPFWESYWNGGFAVSARIFLMINLFLIALGMGASWKSAGLSGLVPLGTFLFYNLANAFARTSGGRYVVPMDWIVLFYFALGLFQIILWGMTLFGLKDDTEKITTNQNEIESLSWTWEPLKKAPLIIFFFLFIGASLLLSERLYPRRYTAQSQTELFSLLEREGHIQEMGFDSATLLAVSEQWPNFKVVIGRALYPRYFSENKGIPKNRYPYNEMGFPRIAFTMIGPGGWNYVVLPEDEVPYFPNASDVIVLGCQEGANIDALAVVVIDKQTVVYVRQPVSQLQCPLQQPVCNENHVCR